MDESFVLASNLEVPVDTLHIAAGIMGNLFALVLFVSPVPTFGRITTKKSIEQFSALPYLFALLNCLICTWYGLPFVSSDNILVTTVNAVGAIFQLTYICIYLVYSPKEVKIKVLSLLSAGLGVFLTIALVSYLILEQPVRRVFVGCLTVISLISMFASPLSIMKLVVETNSVEYMPFYLSLSAFFMSTSFFAYGLLGSDFFISVPNGIGSILGLTQLALFLYYKNFGSRTSEGQPLIDQSI